MSTTEPMHLREGRIRAQRRRENDAIRRVRAWQRWCRTDGDFATMPDLPSDADYRIARRVNGSTRR